MAKKEITNIDDAIYYYPDFFDKPSEVLKETSLSRKEKIRVLKNWKHDIELQQVAVEENMNPSLNNSVFDDINNALLSLKSDEDTEHTPPTKLGGM